MRCAACGAPKAFAGMGAVMVCRDCDPIVREAMETSRRETGQVDVARICRQIYLQTHSGGNYLFRDIPAELKARAEHRAIDEGCSLREIILRSLEQYTAKERTK